MIKKYTNFLLVLGFVTPILLSYHYPLSSLDFVICAALLITFFLPISVDFKFTLILCSLSISILSVTLGIVFGSVSLRSLVSVLFFYKVYMAYYVGFCFFDNMSNFLARISKLAPIFIIFITALVLLEGSDYRGKIAVGSIEVFGSNGTNALMVYLATLLMIFDASYKGKCWPYFYLILIFGFCIVLLSGSRQALLGLFIYYILQIRVSNVIVITLISLCIFVILQFIDLQVLQAKFARDIQAISELDFNSFSAGRLSIYIELLKETLKSPIWGKQFSGFDQNSSLSFSNLQGLSPHNQYLGALWKMGIIGFAPYAIFLYLCFELFFRVKGLPKAIHKKFQLFAIVVFVIFMNTQDFLTFALTGFLFMYVCGSFAKNNELERSKVL